MSGYLIFLFFFSLIGSLLLLHETWYPHPCEKKPFVFASVFFLVNYDILPVVGQVYLSSWAVLRRC